LIGRCITARKGFDKTSTTTAASDAMEIGSRVAFSGGLGVVSGVWYEVHMPSLLAAGVSVYLFESWCERNKQQKDAQEDRITEHHRHPRFSLPAFVVGFVAGKETLRYYGEAIAGICFH